MLFCETYKLTYNADQLLDANNFGSHYTNHICVIIQESSEQKFETLHGREMDIACFFQSVHSNPQYTVIWNFYKWVTTILNIL